MRTPSSRKCCTARHTSERVVPNSSAIRVPLMTSVALSLSRRTMRPEAGVSQAFRGRHPSIVSRARDRRIMRVRIALEQGLGTLCDYLT